jgi:preprotein translocase subunit SecD
MGSPPDRSADGRARRAPLRLALVARILMAGIVVVMAGCGSDASEPSPSGTPSTTIFELREVLEAVSPDSPGWDSLEVTCIDIEGTGPTGCLDPGEAADEEVVLLDQQGETKYRLAPATVTGEDVASAAAVELDPQSVSGWGVEIQLDAAGTQAFADLTTGLVGRQLAIVVDGVVVSAPTVQEPITIGAVQASSLSEMDAEALAQNLGSSA